MSFLTELARRFSSLTAKRAVTARPVTITSNRRLKFMNASNPTVQPFRVCKERRLVG